LELLLLDIAAAIALALRLALAHGRLWGISGHVGRVEMLIDLSLQSRTGMVIGAVRLTGYGDSAWVSPATAKPPSVSANAPALTK
jgi:hypothetical protein